MKQLLFGICWFLSLALHAASLNYSVSWLGNSFSGASNKWVQNFFIHTKVQPDGTVNTWSHWDEGGKKFGVYKDGDVTGNANVSPNSLETTDQAGRRWNEGNDMRHISRVFICKGYLAGNRKPVSFTPGAGKEAECVAAAGDYVFTGGWKERGRIWINRLDDGAEVGVFEPGPTVGGVENTGWIDILNGISAHRRANGEYLVFVEEDYKAKVLLYRWKP